jgi:hypothetical protein
MIASPALGPSPQQTPVHHNPTRERWIGVVWRNPSPTFRVVIFCLMMLFTCQTAKAAHPFHTTFAEIEWNAETQRFEVALQLPGLQIDEELSRIHKRRINTETSAEAETLLEDYITNRFEITDKSHSRCRIHWVGMEVELRDVWAYFEVELIKSPTIPSAEPPSDDRAAPSNGEPKLQTASPFEGLTISNRILTDVLAGQLNMASIIVEHQRASLNLTAEQSRGIASFERQNDPTPSR